jgi:hypothetical protein
LTRVNRFSNISILKRQNIGEKKLEKIKSKYFKYTPEENGVKYSELKVRVNYKENSKEIVGFDYTPSSVRGGCYILSNKHNRFKLGRDRWSKFLNHMNDNNITL